MCCPSIGAGRRISGGVSLNSMGVKGGVLGKQIKYVIYDNKNDGQETISAYTRLADVDKASAVITTDASGIFMSLIEISSEKKVPVCGMPSDRKLSGKVLVVGVAGLLQYDLAARRLP